MHPCSLSRSWSGRWRRYDATRTAHRVFLAVGSTDTRKSINGLSIMVEQVMDQNPFTGDLFVFCNRKRNMIKILYWNYNGFCIWLKRLEQHRFTCVSGCVKMYKNRRFKNVVSSSDPPAIFRWIALLSLSRHPSSYSFFLPRRWPRYDATVDRAVPMSVCCHC